MHVLLPKHTILNEKEAQELLERLNVSKTQLPKILSNDAGLLQGAKVGDIIKLERKQENLSKKLREDNGKVAEYYRVVA